MLIHKPKISRANEKMEELRSIRQKMMNDNRTNQPLTVSEKVSAIVPIAHSIIFGKEVSDERYEKRVEICKACPLMLLDDNNEPHCGICQCKIKAKKNAIVNFAKFEENERYGCKHPLGSRWKENGV